MVDRSRPTNKFPKSKRLRNSREFAIAFRSGIVCADNVLVVHACLNARPHARLGLSIGKRVGNAVVRNRWKRLIREAFRTQQSELPAHIDLVIRPRKGAIADHAAIRSSIVRLARKANQRIQTKQGKQQSP